MAKPLSRRVVVKAAAGVAATTLPISFAVRDETAEAVAMSVSEPYKPPVPTGLDGKPLSGEALAHWEATQRIPGIAFFEVSLFADGDPNYAVKGLDGTVWPGGETLAEWRAKYGGDIGEMTHYNTGQKFRIDLSPYAHLDPHRTRVRVVGHFMASLEAQRERPSRSPRESIDPRPIIRISHIKPDDIRSPTGIKPYLTEGLATGTVRLQVSAFGRGDLGKLMDEPRGDKGYPLAEYRAAIGGDEGEILDPFYGQLHHLSLVPYAHADPETTHLRVQFIFTPDGHEEARRQVR